MYFVGAQCLRQTGVVSEPSCHYYLAVAGIKCADGGTKCLFKGVLSLPEPSSMAGDNRCCFNIDDIAKHNAYGM